MCNAHVRDVQAAGDVSAVLLEARGVGGVGKEEAAVVRPEATPVQMGLGDEMNAEKKQFVKSWIREESCIVQGLQDPVYSST